MIERLIALYETCLKRIVRELPVNSRASRMAIAALNEGALMKGKQHEKQSKEESNSLKEGDDDRSS